jgi:hypothetical protein
VIFPGFIYVLKYHVDSNQEGAKIESTDPDDVFELANGYATIGAGVQNAITFASSKFKIINDAEENSGTLPAHADFWLIWPIANANVQAAVDVYELHLAYDSNFEQKNPNLYKMTDESADQVFSEEMNHYADWNDALHVHVFKDEKGNSGLFLGIREIPPHTVPSTHVSSQANAELVFLVVDITILVSKKLSDRMASIKG